MVDCGAGGILASDRTTSPAPGFPDAAKRQRTDAAGFTPGRSKSPPGHTCRQRSRSASPIQPPTSVVAAVKATLYTPITAVAGIMQSLHEPPRSARRASAVATAPTPAPMRNPIFAPRRNPCPRDSAPMLMSTPRSCEKARRTAGPACAGARIKPVESARTSMPMIGRDSESTVARRRTPAGSESSDCAGSGLTSKRQRVRMADADRSIEAGRNRDALGCGGWWTVYHPASAWHPLFDVVDLPRPSSPSSH